MTERGDAEIQLEQHDDGVRVRGDLTIATAKRAVDRSRELLGATDVSWFDLDGLGQCDSAALAVLLEWRRQSARRGRELHYRNVPERLMQLARISDLNDVLGFGAAR